MKKRTLKLVVVAGLMTLMMVGFAGCKKTECEGCGEMKSCSTYDSALLGEIELCKDCKSEMKEAEKELEELADELEGLFD
ncbi:MAG: hypothetical protein IJW37_02750 [Lachnospiraceae bacterium]|nr:hypothetical protein [Lachnospiraceae bacterium]